MKIEDKKSVAFSKTNSEKSVIVYGHFLVSDNFHTIKMWK